MWAGIAAFLTVVGKVLGLFQSQADANAAAVQKQAGVDAEKAASLEKSVAVARDQATAVMAAPTTEAGTIVDLRKGRF
jgi:hypothetical protein